MEQMGIFQILRRGIIAALKREFALPIYGEKNLNRAKKPCFTVELLETSQKNLLGARKIQSIGFKICYFPQEGQVNRMELQETAEIMYDALFIIEQDGESFLPAFMKHQVQNEKLDFTVEYHIHVLIKKEYEKMGTLTYNGRKSVGF